MVRIIFLILLIYPKILLAQRIGIIGAMPEEIEGFKSLLSHTKVKHYKDLTFFQGKIHNKKVVLMLGGVGKVNAAYSTAIMLEKYNIKQLLFSGVAGGLHPEALPGDLVIGKEVFHHDYARHQEDIYEVRATRSLRAVVSNPLFFKADSTLVSAAQKAAKEIVFKEINQRKPKVFVGKIATGDVFLNNATKAAWLHKEFDALAVEMEGAAVGQIAWQCGVPFLIIRSFSDNANNAAQVDFETFKVTASENAKLMVEKIIEILP